ncbi:MAG: type III pantothenate kinase [Cellvibrionaceae bacterium]
MGNSSLKWRLRDGAVGAVGDVVSVPVSAQGYDYNAIFEDLVDSPVEIRVACVVPALRQAFSDWSIKVWQLEPCYAVVSREAAGVLNGYSDVSQMGVDRWVAMLAAYSACQNACLVVDAGTAMTVDLVLLSGQHRGGYITPGLGLMDDVLFDQTGIREVHRVKHVAISYDGALGAGSSTQSAVLSGLYSMQLGLLLLALDELCIQCEGPPDVVFSGGAGSALAEMFRKCLLAREEVKKVREIMYSPALVLDGLSLSVNHNNTKIKG